MRKTDSPNRSAIGYSLVEVIVVAALIGVLATISVGLINWKSQVLLSNLENMRAFIEAVRRASLKGQSCTISISTSNLADNSTILTATPVGSKIQANPCGSPQTLQLDSGYSKIKYLLSVTSGAQSVSSFTVTPRGTLFNSSSTPVFESDLIFTLRTTDNGSSGSSDNYCLKLAGFLGTVQGIGTTVCE